MRTPHQRRLTRTDAELVDWSQSWLASAVIPCATDKSCSWLDFLSRLLLSPKSLSSSSSLFPFTISRAQNKHCPYRGQRRAGLIARFINGGLSSVPQILGGSPGSASGSTFSRSLTTLGGGKNTVSRLFTLPFPLSFCANGFQHSEQISYSLPSISFCRQSFASPQRSQIIMDLSP